MIEKIIKHKLLLISIHILIGFLATFRWFPKPYTFVIIIAFAVAIVAYKNKNEAAFLFAAYISAAEVFIRMTKGFILYETGKYAVIFFLLLGIFNGQYKQKFATQYVFYIMLLMLGIVFTQVPEGESLRKAIIFNLSGPIVLGVAAFYFYKRPIIKKDLMNSLFMMILPLISMVTYLYFRTPDLKEIVFGGTANFEASGGFGPNQVATAIGLGIFIISILMIMKEKITGYVFLDALLLIYFIYRGLLTFSRGGILTGVIALVVFALFYSLHSKGALKLLLKYGFTAIIFTSAIWVYTSGATGGMLSNRYAGKNAAGVQKEDISSGRIAILETQVKNFFVNPVGIGVGNGKYKRITSGEHVTAASHNEVGRLIEEHGVIGGIILLLLLTVPLFSFFNGTNYQRGFLISFYLLWFLTINHSAMRIAFPGFIYALSLINIVDDE